MNGTLYCHQHRSNDTLINDMTFYLSAIARKWKTKCKIKEEDMTCDEWYPFGNNRNVMYHMNEYDVGTSKYLHNKERFHICGNFIFTIKLFD